VAIFYFQGNTNHIAVEMGVWEVCCLYRYGLQRPRFIRSVDWCVPRFEAMWCTAMQDIMTRTKTDKNRLRKQADV